MLILAGHQVTKVPSIKINYEGSAFPINQLLKQQQNYTTQEHKIQKQWLAYREKVKNLLSCQLLFISLAKLFSCFRAGDGRVRRLLLSVPFLWMWHHKNVLSGWTQGWTVNELWSKVTEHVFLGITQQFIMLIMAKFYRCLRGLNEDVPKGHSFFTVTALYSAKNALAIIQRHSSKTASWLVHRGIQPQVLPELSPGWLKQWEDRYTCSAISMLEGFSHSHCRQASL